MQLFNVNECMARDLVDGPKDLILMKRWMASSQVRTLARNHSMFGGYPSSDSEGGIVVVFLS